MRQANLKPVPDDEPKILDAQTIEQIIGRPFEKPKLMPPHFEAKPKPEVSHGTMKAWLMAHTK